MDDELYVMACRVWNEIDYDPQRRALWYRVVRETLMTKGMSAPIIYPGSLPAPCEKCGVTVAVGPRQQEQRRKVAASMIICLLCVADLHGEIQINTLGNPDDPNRR
jgi:hypothetical protein